MREALTEQLKCALAQAQQEARGLNQEFVGTEHLLLGLLAVNDTEALAGLKLAGVERDALRRLATHTGHTAQGVDEPHEQRGISQVPVPRD